MHASIPNIAAGLCNGASSIQSSISFITSSFIITGFVNFSPPCTILCPIPSISSTDFITPYCLLKSLSNTNFIAFSWLEAGFSKLCFSPLTLCVKKELYCPILS